MTPAQPEVGAGLDALFAPNAITVIGASDDVTKIGGRPLQFLLKYGFAGGIYPVNRKGGTVQGLTAYASVADLPEAPALAVIAVPPQAVPEAVHCACLQSTVSTPSFLSATPAC